MARVMALQPHALNVLPPDCYGCSSRPGIQDRIPHCIMASVALSIRRVLLPLISLFHFASLASGAREPPYFPIRHVERTQSTPANAAVSSSALARSPSLPLHPDASTHRATQLFDRIALQRILRTPDPEHRYWLSALHLDRRRRRTLDALRQRLTAARVILDPLRARLAAGVRRGETLYARWREVERRDRHFAYPAATWTTNGPVLMRLGTAERADERETRRRLQSVMGRTRAELAALLPTLRPLADTLWPVRGLHGLAEPEDAAVLDRWERLQRDWRWATTVLRRER